MNEHNRKQIDAFRWRDVFTSIGRLLYMRVRGGWLIQQNDSRGPAPLTFVPGDVDPFGLEEET